MANRRQRYDVALNGQGLILAKNPEQPDISAKQEDSFYLRYNNGDHNYNDLAKYWYWVQTDWSAGFKDDLSWVDDSKYYYLSNIDAISVVGAFRLSILPTLVNNAVAQDITCGIEAIINNTLGQYIGTNGGTKAIIYQNQSGTWTDITSSTWSTSPYKSNLLNERNNNLWAHNLSQTDGVSFNWFVTYFDGSHWTDCALNIATALGITMTGVVGSRAAVAASNGNYYVFVDCIASFSWGLVSCSKNSPNASGDWTKILFFNGTTNNIPVAACEYNAKIYYLLTPSFGGSFELRVYDPTASSDSHVAFFYNSDIDILPNLTNNLLKVVKNILVIAIPNKELWGYDGSSLNRVYLKDLVKQNIGQEAYAYLYYGGIVADNKYYSGNLITDTTDNQNWIKDVSDSPQGVFIPLFSDKSNNIWGIDTASTKKIYKVIYRGTTYKGSADKNFIVFNNFDKIYGVDKLGFYITVLFDALLSGQKIILEYTTDNIITSTTNWTEAGRVDYTNIQDRNITEKNIYFPSALVHKKVWMRYKLVSDGTNTPTVYDHAMAYKPWPDRKLEWHLQVKCIDEIIRKDSTKETKTGIWLRNFLRQSWRQKAVLTYEDYDADTNTQLTDNPLDTQATTVNVVSTDNFPETGRILIDTEEIFYSGKTKTSFLNCVRGYNATNVASHNVNSDITLAYRVYIDDYTEDLVVANNPTEAEYFVNLTLREV